MSQALALFSQGGKSQFSTKRKIPWPLTELWIAKREGPCFAFGCIHGTHLAHHRDELIHTMSISPKWEPRILTEVRGLPRPELRERLLQGPQEWFSNRSFSIDKKERERKEGKKEWEKERRKSKREGKKERKEGRQKELFKMWKVCLSVLPQIWVHQTCDDADVLATCLG